MDLDIASIAIVAYIVALIAGLTQNRVRTAIPESAGSRWRGTCLIDDIKRQGCRMAMPLSYTAPTLLSLSFRFPLQPHSLPFY